MACVHYPLVPPIQKKQHHLFPEAAEIYHLEHLRRAVAFSHGLYLPSLQQAEVAKLADAPS